LSNAHISGNLYGGTSNAVVLADNNYLHVKSTNGLFSSTASGSQGTYIGWNTAGGGLGYSDFTCNKGGGEGGFDFFIQDSLGSANINSPIIKINSNGLYIDPSGGNGGLYVNKNKLTVNGSNGNTTIAGTLNVSGNISASSGITGSTGSFRDLIATNVIIPGLANYTTYTGSDGYSETTLVPKQYVDQFVSGIVVKEPAVAIQMGSPIVGDYDPSGVGFIKNVTTDASKNLVIDGVIILDGNSVLLNSQINNNVENGVYIWDSSNNILTRRKGMQNGQSAQGAYVFVKEGTKYKKTAWVGSSTDASGNQAVVGVNNLIFNEISYYDYFDYTIGRGLDVDSISGVTSINVDTSLNFINFLDSNTSNGGDGTLAIGTATTSEIILGPTGGIPIQAQSIIEAQQGITGGTGSFSYLSSSQEILAPKGITGGTGSFSYLSASQEILAPKGITGTTGSFSYLSASQEILAPKGITGTTGSFSYLSASSGITGGTGSFSYLLASQKISAPLGITGGTGSFSYLASSNNTYLATTSGRVGIGKTSAGYNLDVSGNFRVDAPNAGEFSIEDDTNNFNYNGFPQPNNKGVKVFWNYPSGSNGKTIFLNNGQGGAGGFGFYQCYVDGKTPVRATLTCGNLGIGGIESPSQPLDVSGNANIRGTLIASQQISAPKGITGTTGSFSYLTGATGSFRDLTATNVVIPGLANYTTYNPGSYTNPLTLVPKQYVDQFVSGLSIKEAVVAIQTGTPIGGTYVSSGVGSITGVSSSLTIDTIPILDGSAVLLNSQTDPSHNGVYVWTPATSTLTRRSGMQNGQSAKSAYVFVKQGIKYAKTAWVQSSNDPSNQAIVGTDSLLFIPFSSFDYEIGRGLDVDNTGGLTTINVDTSLNFINFLDSTTGVTGASGILAMGTATTSGIILGPTGGIPIQTQSIIEAQKGITGAAGSFDNLISKSLSVSGVSNFNTLPTYIGSLDPSSNPSPPPTQNQFITKQYADNTYTNTTGNILGSNNVWRGVNEFDKSVIAPAGITGATGSFSYLSASTNTYLATTSGGRVGIGKTTANFNLDVSGNFISTSQDAGEFSVGDSNNNFKYSGFSQPYDKGVKIFWNHPNTGYGRTTFLNNGQNVSGGFDFYHCDSSQQTPVLATLNCGKLGIGNTLPSYPLDVSGNGRFTGTVTAGTVTANSFNSLSDYRIKENIIPLDHTFIVDSLIPVTYKNKHTEKQDIGLIAHEVQEIYPFLVNGDKDGEEFQSVNYTGLIALLIKEIKELKQRVKALEHK
jgi:hypothetical protein